MAPYPAPSPQAVLEGHARALVAVEALGDGRVVSASNDNTIRLWRLSDNTCERVIAGQHGGVYALAVAALNPKLK